MITSLSCWKVTEYFYFLLHCISLITSVSWYIAGDKTTGRLLKVFQKQDFRCDSILLLWSERVLSEGSADEAMFVTLPVLKHSTTLSFLPRWWNLLCSQSVWMFVTRCVRTINSVFVCRDGRKKYWRLKKSCCSVLSAILDTGRSAVKADPEAPRCCSNRFLLPNIRLDQQLPY